MDWLNADVLWTFFWKIVNFLVLAGLVVYFARRFDVINKVFGGYQHKIKAEVDTATRLHEEAAQIKREIERAAREAETRTAEMLEGAKAQAEREREALMESARQAAEHIRAQAQQTADYERERQLLELQREVVDRVIVQTRDQIAQSITKTDHERLVKEFINGLSAESLRER